MAEAKAGIGAWLDFYNEERRHQSLGYPPRRDKFTRKARGYVDDRLCRPALLPPPPERARKAGNARLRHIPIGATANKGFDVDEVNSKIVKSAVALTAIGAEIEIGRAIP